MENILSINFDYLYSTSRNIIIWTSVSADRTYALNALDTRLCIHVYPPINLFFANSDLFAQCLLVSLNFLSFFFLFHLSNVSHYHFLRLLYSHPIQISQVPLCVSLWPSKQLVPSVQLWMRDHFKLHCGSSVFVIVVAGFTNQCSSSPLIAVAFVAAIHDLLCVDYSTGCVSTVRVGRALFVPSIDVITTFIYLIYLHICILLCWYVQWFVSVNVHKLLVILYICCLCDYVAFISMSGSGF